MKDNGCAAAKKIRHACSVLDAAIPPDEEPAGQAVAAVRSAQRTLLDQTSLTSSLALSAAKNEETNCRLAAIHHQLAAELLGPLLLVPFFEFLAHI